MKKSITLKLINNEKRNVRILSAKACITDNAACSNGATDICQSLDYAGCYGIYTYDYCKYVDVASCSNGAFDRCEYDYVGCYVAATDSIPCGIDA